MNASIIPSTLKLLALRHKSREAVLREQQKALRKLIRHAFTHSEFYHQLYTAAGITEDDLDTLSFRQLPTIDKNMLMEHYRQVLTVPEDVGQEELQAFQHSGSKGKYLGKYQIVHSSGSTGVPRFFLYDEEAWNKTIAGAISSILMGLPMMDAAKILVSGIRVMFLGAVGGFGAACMVRDVVDALKAQVCSVDINEPLENWARRYLDFQPNFIVGYPTAIRIMAEQVQNKGKPGSVRMVFSSGEPLSAQNRAFLGSVFGAPVINFYAASESLAIGTDIGEGSTLYLPDYLNYIEVQNGKMYLTNLSNYAQPLIRYRISDCMELISEEQRSHKLPFTQCRLIKGRDDDIFWFRDRNGHPEFLHPLTMEDFCIPGLMDYQIIQDSNNFFHVNAALSGDTQPEHVLPLLTQQIQAVLDEHHLDFIQFQVIPVNLILPDERTGKKRLAIPLRREKDFQQKEIHYAT